MVQPLLLGLLGRLLRSRLLGSLLRSFRHGAFLLSSVECTQAQNRSQRFFARARHITLFFSAERRRRAVARRSVFLAACRDTFEAGERWWYRKLQPRVCGLTYCTSCAGTCISSAA